MLAGWVVVLGAQQFSNMTYDVDRFQTENLWACTVVDVKCQLMTSPLFCRILFGWNVEQEMHVCVETYLDA